MNDRFAFLKSTRFWKIVIIAVLEGMLALGVIDGQTSEVVTKLIEFVLGGSVVIRTVDRLGEKAGSEDTK